MSARTGHCTLACVQVWGEESRVTPKLDMVGLLSAKGGDDYDY